MNHIAEYVAPRAISPNPDKNCTSPAPSLMAWLSRTAKMKPPHSSRVTYYSKLMYIH
ncbi:hypothetical protein Hanom_Chr11g01053741 [Helianthus anomalus]